jgi:hypothetical protein
MMRNMKQTTPAVTLEPLAPAQLRTLRAHESLVAEASAERCMRAIEDRHERAARNWDREYRRAAARCRALGELMRARRLDPAVR